MEFKFLCPCGTKYAFDAEPVDGRMPWAVKCPNCGADATEYTNGMIQQRLGIVAPAAPARIEPAPAPKVRVSIAQPAHAVAAALPAAPGVEIPEAHGTAHARPSVPSSSVPRIQSQFKPRREPSLLLGLTGAAAGGLVGMLAWVGFYFFSEIRFGMLALLVGFLAGFCGKLCYRGTNPWFGPGVGFCALVFILGANYWMATGQVSRFVDKTAAKVVDETFNAQLEYARETLAAIPNRTDQEIKLLLAKRNAVGGEQPDPSKVSSDDVKDFRDIELPEMVKLTSGKTTKETFRKDFEKAVDEVEDTGAFKIVMVFKTIGIFNLFWIVAGVGYAYRLAMSE